MEEEYPNDLLGHIVAAEGLYVLAENLKERGWEARARANTAKVGEHHLHVDGDMFHFMTRPLMGATHRISGQLSMADPEVLTALERLSEDFEAMALEYSLKVTDEDGGAYIQTYGNA